MARGGVADLEFLRRKVFEADGDVLGNLVFGFIQMLMSAEANGACRAGGGGLSGERVNHRNGDRDGPFDTRLCAPDLKVPGLRRGGCCPGGCSSPVDDPDNESSSSPSPAGDPRPTPSQQDGDQ